MNRIDRGSRLAMSFVIGAGVLTGCARPPIISTQEPQGPIAVGTQIPDIADSFDGLENVAVFQMGFFSVDELHINWYNHSASFKIDPEALETIYTQVFRIIEEGVLIPLPSESELGKFVTVRPSRNNVTEYVLAFGPSNLTPKDEEAEPSTTKVTSFISAPEKVPDVYNDPTQHPGWVLTFNAGRDAFFKLMSLSYENGDELSKEDEARYKTIIAHNLSLAFIARSLMMNYEEYIEFADEKTRIEEDGCGRLTGLGYSIIMPEEDYYDLPIFIPVSPVILPPPTQEPTETPIPGSIKA